MSDTSEHTLHYSMIIEWSVEDEAFVVSVPEFPGQHTHGASYEEAVTQGRDLIDSLILWTLQDGKPLPQPHVFTAA
jgi:predicted RNase H-like HicB family nuclease